VSSCGLCFCLLLHCSCVPTSRWQRLPIPRKAATLVSWIKLATAGPQTGVVKGSGNSCKHRVDGSRCL